MFESSHIEVSGNSFFSIDSLIFWELRNIIEKDSRLLEFFFIFWFTPNYKSGPLKHCFLSKLVIKLLKRRTIHESGYKISWVRAQKTGCIRDCGLEFQELWSDVTTFFVRLIQEKHARIRIYIAEVVQYQHPQKRPVKAGTSESP